jgi:1,4-dihydroxy-2-naphthoate octaprenyltransferase
VEVGMKLKIHLWTLPRWFAAPIFGSSAVLGGLLAGGMSFNSWLGVIGTLLIMAGGHSFNSFLDYSWTGLDKGKTEDRSAEKDYSGGQSVIAAGLVSPREVAINALAWYALALIPLIYLAVKVDWFIIVLGLLGMLGTFAYAKSKFNWTHEFVLGSVAGPIPVLAGMFATNASPPWVTGLVVGIPSFILISFFGLALDEWPDAEANLKKGVKSISYKVWEYGISLEWYLSVWILFVFLYQVFLISIGILDKVSAISFFTFPFLMSFIVLLKQNFRKWAGWVVITGVLFPVLMVLGHYLGR